MIRASLIYIGVTILLALFDAIRIRLQYGKTANIDHALSRELAGVSIGIVACIGVLTVEKFSLHWVYRYLVVCAGLLCIRFTLYDVAINFARIITKTNPTMRLDYESKTTTSWVDQHIPLSFWQKRAIGVVGWFIVWIVYCKIF